VRAEGGPPGAIDPEVVLRGQGKHLHYGRGVTVRFLPSWSQDLQVGTEVV